MKFFIPNSPVKMCSTLFISSIPHKLAHFCKKIKFKPIVRFLSIVLLENKLILLLIETMIA